MTVAASRQLARIQQVREADPMQHLGAQLVGEADIDQVEGRKASSLARPGGGQCLAPASCVSSPLL
jgi:hypothetical protein